jgi:hypothetical protein
VRKGEKDATNMTPAMSSNFPPLCDLGDKPRGPFSVVKMKEEKKERASSCGRGFIVGQLSQQ